MRWLIKCFSDGKTSANIKYQSNKAILEFLSTKYNMKDEGEEWGAAHMMTTTNKYYEEYVNAQRYIGIVQEYMQIYVMDGFSLRKKRSKKKVKEILMNLELNLWMKGVYKINDENTSDNDGHDEG